MSAPEPPPLPQRQLTQDEVRAALSAINPGAGDPLNSAIDSYAKGSRQDPRDLLNEAVKRALSTRSVPAYIPFEAVLAGIARSIASGINIARARANRRFAG